MRLLHRHSGWRPRESHGWLMHARQGPGLFRGRPDRLQELSLKTRKGGLPGGGLGLEERGCRTLPHLKNTFLPFITPVKAGPSRPPAQRTSALQPRLMTQTTHL